MSGDGRVLVVGPAVGDVAATLEGSLAVTTLAVADPERARSLLDERRVDCVVTDLRFSAEGESPRKAGPDDSGLAFLESLRERDPTLPVVVYTGIDLDGLDPAALAGATACVRRERAGAEERLCEWVERAVAARSTDRDRLAGVVHDLRNPLRAANVSLARFRQERDGDSDHLTDLAAAHERLGELLDDLDALLDAGRPDCETEPVALDAAAREAWRAVDTRDATLRVETDATVEADPGRLRRLLENCLANAVEHGSTSPGSQARQDAVEHGSTADAESDVTVRVGDLDREGFFVADDGPGIPPADRDAVFERGYSTADGTGYGLAIVAEVAAAHGWSVAATDSESGGARIEVRTE